MGTKLDSMRRQLKNERTQRGRNWVEHSWDHKKQDIYNWIRGKKGNGPLIVNQGGSAQMKDILTLAEDTWGGLWVVEADDLPQFETTHATHHRG
eukprot:7782027-Heterocapsa_arctica.AAC.2